MRSKIKTEAIVLRKTNYGETSIIFNVLTNELGLTGLIAKGVRKEKSRYKPSLFQPFTILDLVINHNQKKDLHYFSEMRCLHPLYNIYTDASKSAIVFFLCELVNNCVRYPHEDKDLFLFLKKSIMALEHLETGIGVFHLHFMIQMVSFLGFHIENASKIIDDVLMSNYNMKIPTKKAINYLDELYNSSYGDVISIKKSDKHILIDIILVFFQIHYDQDFRINSLEILKKTFS